MRSLLSLAAFGLAIGVLGCSGGGGGGGNSGAGGSNGASGKLTCEWLAGPVNCWQTAVDEAYTDCAVPESGEGYFGDEYLSCSYPNGDNDVYGSAGRTLDGGGNGHDDFYVEATRQGKMCFRFEAPATVGGTALSTWSLTTKSGTVTYANTADGMSIQCPNGSTFSATGLDVVSMLSCPMKKYPDGSSIVPLPGYWNSMSRFALLPGPTVSTGDSLTRCTCAPQQYDGGGVPPPEPPCPSL